LADIGRRREATGRLSHLAAVAAVILAAAVAAQARANGDHDLSATDSINSAGRESFELFPPSPPFASSPRNFAHFDVLLCS